MNAESTEPVHLGISQTARGHILFIFFPFFLFPIFIPMAAWDPGVVVIPANSDASVWAERPRYEASLEGRD